MEKSLLNFGREIVMECSRMYGFDGKEACERLRISLEKKEEKKSKVKEIVYPFQGEVDEKKCQGVLHNYGLYTQCMSEKSEGIEYCSKCTPEPKYGDIRMRKKAYDEGKEYKDPLGKCEVSYLSVLKKLKLTREEVEEDAAKKNKIISPIYFEEPAKKEKPVKEVKAKGRPKKNTNVLELKGEEEDLFASIVSSVNKLSINDDVKVKSEDELSVKSEGESSLKSEGEKSNSSEAKKQAAAELKKQEAEAKKQAAAELKKQEAELKKQAAEAKKQAAAELKKQAAELKKQEAEAKKQATEEAKKQKAQMDKDAKKKAADEEKALAVEKKRLEEISKPIEEDKKEEADKVIRITFENQQYYKSKNTGVIYNLNETVVGMWNESKNRIDFNAEDEKDSDEESEVDYESDTA